MALVDSEKKVLITRRNITLKIFPHAWVLPGGHVDPGETLEEAVIRELVEETGVEITSTLIDGELHYYYIEERCFLRPYYAYESVSMLVFDASEPPNSCHLIVFFTIELAQKASDIKLKL